MWKFIKWSIKFIIVWKFTIWYLGWINLPILEVLQQMHIASSRFWNWLIGGSEGSIIFIVLAGTALLIISIIIICCRYSKPTSDYSGYYY